MKRTAALFAMFLLLISIDVSGQIKGAQILGNFNVASTLTGDTLGSPEPGHHVDYEWFWSDSTSRGTNDTYTILASDQGKGIYVVASEMTGSNNLVRYFNSDTTVVNSRPVATFPMIAGEAKPSLTLYGTYVYSDADGDSELGTTFRWHRATSATGTGTTPINLATGQSYKLTDADFGYYIGFSVKPGASAGSVSGVEVFTPAYVQVKANLAPTATVTAITGTLNTGDVLIGHYSYSDPEGDTESGSVYKWYRRTLPTDTWSVISGANGISYQLTVNDQGKYLMFSVTPKALTGTDSNTETQSPSTALSNTKPYVTGVYISGNDSVGETLTAHYTFHDDHDGQGASVRQWYRGTDPISGANSMTYILTGYDLNKIITFRVTPVTDGSGEPKTGVETVSANSKGPVEDPNSSPPSVTDICIDGIRKVDQYVYGKYFFINKYDEASSGSEKLWFRGKTIVKSSFSSFRYKLVEADMNAVIRFAVIPKNELGEIGDTVFSTPLAIFNISKDIFSVNDSAFLLKALPMGGDFFGNGVDSGYFHPSVVGVQADPIELSYVLPVINDSTSCSQTTYKNVSVRPSVVVFFGDEEKYCEGHGPETIYMLNVPAGATSCKFTITDPNAGLIQLNDTTAIFNPDLMKTGINQDIIEFTYMDGKIFDRKTLPLVIDHIGPVTIRNLNPGTSFCGNITPFELIPSHPGGDFSGPVTAAGVLDPSLMYRGYGDSTVVYTYESQAGCIKTISVPVSFNPLPVVDFRPFDFCILDANDSTRMVNETIETDTVGTWLWEFSESGITTTSAKKAPAYLYKLGGDHRIFLTATTIKGCTSKAEKTFDLGVKPDAGFTWKNECYHEDDSLHLFDATISSSVIKSRSWIFNGQDTISDIMNPRYPMDTIGPLPVKYLVTTGYAGCDDEITYNIYIRPTITIKKDGYSQNFETSAGDWVQDYESINSWTYGTPDRDSIRFAYSGTKAWFTKFDSAMVEASAVISPCFNFDSIQRPMIKLWLFSRFDWNRDGAALQYKIGDAPTWEYVGTLDDGINWYNSTLIKGRPGGDQLGWSSHLSDTLKWVESRHKLDELTGKTDVKFRIIYGSDGTAQDNEGVAFDDIWIGQRTRSVLLEHFANLSSVKSSTATGKVNTVSSDNMADVINIQYHTNFPGADAYYNDNPGDNSARVLYYGLVKSPYSFLDGGSDADNYAKPFDYTLATINTNDVIRRSLINPYFEIALNSDTSKGLLKVSGQIRALENISGQSNMTLFVAVTEKENDEHTGASGETVFYNVFRKLIPDAGGINLGTNWTKDEVHPINELVWPMNKMKETSDIEVIAFIQNNITKEVFQAASVIKADIIVGVEDNLFNTKAGFNVWPNPAVNKLTVKFNEPLRRVTEIRILDIQGREISEFKAGAEETEITIENLGLKQGIYLLRVSQGNAVIGLKKLVISGR